MSRQNYKRREHSIEISRSQWFLQKVKANLHKIDDKQQLQYGNVPQEMSDRATDYPIPQ